MSLTRVGVLLGHETRSGSKSFFLIFAIITPLAISLALFLVVGNLFSGTPSLGIVDLGDSQAIRSAAQLESVDSREFNSPSDLRDAVERGSIDMGLILPAGFDQQISQADPVEVSVYVWGESLASDRLVLGATTAKLFRDLSGQDVPVEVTPISLGDGERISIEERMLPLLVLMAVVLGGSMVPASSLVNEKQNRTLSALTITPTTLSDVYIAKGLMGLTLGFLMGVMILLINSSLSGQILLLLLVLFLGALLSATFGVLLGSATKDVTTLFTTIKAIGILLYAPAIVFLFPQIPQWIARLFPTYYIVAPVIDITQKNVGFSDIVFDLGVLVILIFLMLLILFMAIRRTKQHAV